LAERDRDRAPLRLLREPRRAFFYTPSPPAAFATTLSPLLFATRYGARRSGAWNSTRLIPQTDVISHQRAAGALGDRAEMGGAAFSSFAARDRRSSAGCRRGGRWYSSSIMNGRTGAGRHAPSGVVVLFWGGARLTANRRGGRSGDSLQKRLPGRLLLRERRKETALGCWFGYRRDAGGAVVCAHGVPSPISTVPSAHIVSDNKPAWRALARRLFALRQHARLRNCRLLRAGRCLSHRPLSHTGLHFYLTRQQAFAAAAEKRTVENVLAAARCLNRWAAFLRAMFPALRRFSVSLVRAHEGGDTIRTFCLPIFLPIQDADSFPSRWFAGSFSAWALFLLIQLPGLSTRQARGRLSPVPRFQQLFTLFGLLVERRRAARLAAGAPATRCPHRAAHHAYRHRTPSSRLCGTATILGAGRGTTCLRHFGAFIAKPFFHCRRAYAQLLWVHASSSLSDSLPSRHAALNARYPAALMRRGAAATFTALACQPLPGSVSCLEAGGWTFRRRTYLHHIPSAFHAFR